MRRFLMRGFAAGLFCAALAGCTVTASAGPGQDGPEYRVNAGLTLPWGFWRDLPAAQNPGEVKPTK